ncbi:MAG: COQ9 family protein [Alphaproteobacteria bacterium]
MDNADIRDRLVAGIPDHVIFDGWTMKALRGAAADAGLDPGVVVQAFPGGPVEAAEHFSDFCDRRMLAELERRGVGAMKIRERIELAIRVRLELAGDHEVVRRALALLALPMNGAAAVRTTWRTVDAMWHAAGDDATDINFYTKRALLAGVYSGTVLFWLGDSSEGGGDTWEFLDRRLADMMRVFQIRGQVEKRLALLPNPLRLFGIGQQRSGRGGGFGAARADFLRG